MIKQLWQQGQRLIDRWMDGGIDDDGRPTARFFVTIAFVVLAFNFVVFQQDIGLLNYMYSAFGNFADWLYEMRMDAIRKITA